MGPAAALALSLVAATAHARAGPVRLLNADPGAVRIVVDVPEITLDPSPADSSLTSLVIAGFDEGGAPGTPALPVLVVTVAVPPVGRVTISASGSGAESRSGVRLQEMPWIARRPEDQEATRSLTVGEGRSAAPPLARLLGVSWMRDQRVARIAVAPASWEAASQRLTVQHRIDLEVRFEPAPATSAGGATDAFEPLYRDLLVNYEQGRAWRRSAPSAGRGAGASLSGAAPERAGTARATVVPDTSVYAGHRWVKIAIPSSGFYRVEFSQLLNTKLFGGRRDRPLSWLRLFTWPGVPVLPEGNYCDSCDYKEVAIQFVEVPGPPTKPAKPDTLDDNKEYFYFFALGPSDWGSLYDLGLPDTVFVNNPYETRNYFYLTLDSTGVFPGSPARILTDDASFSPADTLSTPSPSTFAARVHYEVDSGGEYWPDAAPIVGRNLDGTYRYSSEAWEKFFWASLTAGNAIEESFDLPGLASGQPVQTRLRVWGLSALVAGSSKSSGTPDHYLDVQVGPTTYPRRQWNGLLPQTYDTTTPGFAETGNQFLIAIPDVPDPDPRFLRFDRAGLAWIDAFYPRRFEPKAHDELIFDSDPAGGTWLYRIAPFAAPATAPPRVFDVTDPLAPVEILGLDYRALSASSFDLRFRRTETGQRRYRVVTDTSFVRPPNDNVADAPNSSLTNLRRPQKNGAYIGGDFLLVYFDGFRAAADSLLRWRTARLPAMTKSAPYDTFSVPISAIFDQFSGGRTDPAAIRNFLRAAYTYWTPRPSYVTFLGDGSYDFKNLTGQAPTGMPGALIPSYENGYDDIVSREFATDDWILNVDDPAIVVPDFYGGRIPAGDVDQAMRYVRDKLLPYERAAPLGEWHDRVMLVADDNEQGSRPDPLGWNHMQQTVRLDVQAMPPEIDRSYVYLHTYPDGPSETKPGAKADILRAIQEGVVMVNYIGHGSPFKLADESVFIDLDATALTNRDRPTVMVAASCDVGKFDNPSVKSIGEYLVLNPNGGAVAVISATELAFSNLNANLNLELYRQIFQRDTLTGHFETPLSKGLLAAKTGLVNNQKYQLMGDAAVLLALPRLYVETVLRDSAGRTVSQAGRGQTLELVGRLLDRPGGSPVSYDGVTRLLVEDSAPVDTTPSCSFDCVAYPFRAAPIFRGDVAIRAGTFSTHFVVPMNAQLGPRGRARPYDELTQGSLITDGTGSVACSITAGSLPTGDREGPRITLGFRGGATAVRPDAVLRVDLFDPSGILITGHTPQNDIIVTLDDDSNQRTDITSSFRYAANSYQSGTAFFRLPGLAPGPHRVRVSAADNLAAGIAAPDHRSSATLDFEVTDNPPLHVTRAILFPNPVRSGGSSGGGQFVVDAPGDSVNVLLRIYTVAGRLVRSLEFHGGLAQVQIPWDGLDAEGDPLARGTYLFKAQVYPREVGGKSSGRQRADADGRFVIIGP